MGHTMLQIIFARDQILPANLKALPAERPKKNGRSYFADLRMGLGVRLGLGQGLGLELVFGIGLVLVKPLLCYVLSL